MFTFRIEKMKIWGAHCEISTVVQLFSFFEAIDILAVFSVLPSTFRFSQYFLNIFLINLVWNCFLNVKMFLWKKNCATFLFFNFLNFFLRNFQLKIFCRFKLPNYRFQVYLQSPLSPLSFFSVVQPWQAIIWKKIFDNLFILSQQSTTIYCSVVLLSDKVSGVALCLSADLLLSLLPHYCY